MPKIKVLLMNVRKRIAQQAYDCEIGESNACK